MAEDLIVWGSADFGVLELPDEFASTSSMMPQKKNPEVPEVVRARASHVHGDFVAAATAMKGMPSTYNLDFQEVTPKLWEAVETVERSLRILAELIPSLRVVQADVSDKAEKSFVGATELANMLVRKYGVPFRSAHKIVGALVRGLIDSEKTFKDAAPELLRKVALDTVGITLAVKAADIAESVNLKKIIESYEVKGGPAPTTVKNALSARKRQMAQAKSNVSKLKQKLDNAEKKLNLMAKSIAEGKISENGRFKNSNR
jgi:argininosuccinate lyase